VLTKTVDGYFPDEDHFVVIFSENCIVDNVCSETESRHTHKKKRETRLSHFVTQGEGFMISIPFFVFGPRSLMFGVRESKAKSEFINELGDYLSSVLRNRGSST
jgi:hypothetical protein